MSSSEVGGTPVAVAVGESGVWVVDNSGALLRLDPNRPAAEPERYPIKGGPSSVAVGEGAVWVASGGGGITRVDPDDGTTKRLDLKVTQPGGIAAGDGSVWVTSSAADALVRIDPASGKVVGDPIDVGSFPTDVAVGDGSVWVANTNSGSVSRIDSSSGGLTDEVEVGDEQALALALGEDGVWVAKTDDASADEIDLVRIDPGSTAVDDSSTEVGAGVPVRIAAGEGGVWTTLVGGPAPSAPDVPPGVALIDPASGDLVATVDVGERPTGIATGAGAVWVANSAEGTVTRIDPSG